MICIANVIGRVSSPPEKSGKSPTKFRVAFSHEVTRPGESRVCDREVEIVAFGWLGDKCLERVRPGAIVLVCGTVQTSDYRSNGRRPKTFTSTSLAARAVHLLHEDRAAEAADRLIDETSIFAELLEYVSAEKL